MASTIKQVQSDDRTQNQFQTNVTSVLNPVLQNALLYGSILPNIALISGTNFVDHKLGRTLQGWIIVRKRADASVYDNQSISPPINPAQILVLVTDQDVTVDLYVF